MPRTIDAHFELVTRAYIGGADDGGRRPAGLRVPSLLGVLRFWWRALEWGRVLDADPPASHGSWAQRYAEPVAALREREGRLFGAAGQGQGLVLASLLDPRNGPQLPKLDGGAAYLAGQGLGNRDAVAAETTFTLRFTVRPRRKKEPAGEEDLASLARALRCLGLLGGVGARSRRGFGSLALRSLSDGDSDRDRKLVWQQPADLAAYRAELQALNERSWSATEPPFTAFSAGSRLTLIPAAAGQDAGDLLAAQGSLFQRFRSKGVQDDGDPDGPHKIGGVPVDTVNHRFRDDFAWFNTLMDTDNAGAGPERAMFGLPHNYFSKSRNGRKAKVLANVPGDATGSAPSDRRASPLFLHIHRPGDGMPVAAWLFLPARFLPDVNSRGPQLLVNERPVNYRPRWCPILDFYTRLGEKPGHVCVWP